MVSLSIYPDALLVYETMEVSTEASGRVRQGGSICLSLGVELRHGENE